MKLAKRLLVLLLLSLSVYAPSRAYAADLVDIEIERTAAETRVHLKADGAITDYREVRLKKNLPAHRPERMYLDLKNMGMAGPIPAVKVGTSLAKVRSGLRPDGVRVVFDSSLDELFDYTISEEPDGLLVTIREPVTVATGISMSEPLPVVEPLAETVMEPESFITPSVVTIQPEPKAAGDLDLVIVAADSPVQTQDWLDNSAGQGSGLEILKTVKTDQVVKPRSWSPG